MILGLLRVPRGAQDGVKIATEHKVLDEPLQNQLPEGSWRVPRAKKSSQDRS